MADESAGSIVGYLRLNDDGFNAVADKATRRALELGRLDPKINVRTNTADAIAKLEAVAAAANRLETVQARVSQSQSRYTTAQTKLTAAQKAYADALKATEGSEKSRADAISRSESAVKRATTSTTTARNALSKASRDAEVAEIGLAAAYQKTSAAADRTVASTERVGRAAEKANKPVSLLGTAAVTLGPALIPVAAYAVAAGVALGSLVGPAGAALLAVKGIAAEMKSGSTLGQAYTKSIAGVKTDLAGLEHSAAGAAAPSVFKGIATLHSFMPELNSETKQYTALLGQAAVNVEHGLLSGFVALRPLTTQMLGYVNQLAAKFDAFASGGGFVKFIARVQASLPGIEHGLSVVGTLIEHLVQAGAGQGVLAFSAIGKLAEALNAIPIGTLKVLIPAISGVYLAFQAWKGIAGIVDTATKALKLFAAAEVAADAAGKGGGAPSALAPAGIGRRIGSAAGGVLSGGAAGALTTAGVVGGAVVGAVALGAAAYYTDKKFGGNQFTPTAPGPTYNLGQKGYVNPNTTASYNPDSITGYAKGGYSDTTAAKDAAAAAATFAAAQRKAAAAAAVSAAAQKTNAAALGETVPQYAAASAAAAKQKTQLAATTAAMQAENDASGLLSAALGKLGNNGLGVASNQTQLALANRAVSDSFKTNGDSVSIQTAKGLANEQALQGQASAALSLADAVAKQTGSSVKSVASLDLSRRGLEANLKATGKLTPSVRAYINSLYDVGKLKVPPTKLDANTTPGKARIAAYQQEINDIKQGKVPGLTADSKAGKAVIAGLQGDINSIKQNHPTAINADGSKAKGAIHTVVELLNGIPVVKSVRLDANGNAVSQIKYITEQIAGLHGKTITINTALSGVNPATYQPGSGRGTGHAAAATQAPASSLSYKPRGAGGGVFPGYAPGVDSIHALLSPGEGVLTPEAVKAIGGAAAVYAINAQTTNRPIPRSNYAFSAGGTVPRFAAGGAVQAGRQQAGAQAGDSYFSGLGLGQTVSGQASSFGQALGAVSRYQSGAGHNPAAVLAQLRKDNTNLVAAIAARATIANALATADANLATAQGNRMGEYTGVRDAITGSGNLTSTNYGDTGAIKTFLAAKVKAALQFGKDEKTALRNGVSPYLVQQLVNAGPDAAGVSLHTLAGASKADIRTINADEVALGKSAKSTAQTSADTFYNAGVSSAQGIVDGLTSKQSAANSAVKTLADGMVATFKKELGIKSPSTVFRAHGKHIGDGLVLGITDRLPHVKLAAVKLSGAALPVSYQGGNRPATRGATVNITVNPSPGMDEEKLGRFVGQHVGEVFRQANIAATYHQPA